MATVLSCSDLSKAFGSDLIFENVSFQLEEHEHLGILGANGVGKSTLLKTIVGQLTPDTGSVTRASGASIGYLAQYQENSVEGTMRSCFPRVMTCFLLRQNFALWKNLWRDYQGMN